jgi:competence protein ComEA
MLLAALIFCVLLIRYYRKTHFCSEPAPLPVIFDVQGAVKRPGIYLREGDPITVGRAIEAAGGLVSGRIPPSLAAAKVSTGQLLRVVSPPDGSFHVEIEPMAAKARLVIGEKLDPNRASADELCLIPKMRPEFARAIVDRRQNRLWRRVEELQEISGVGPKTVEKWKDYLQIGPKQ